MPLLTSANVVGGRKFCPQTPYNQQPPPYLKEETTGAICYTNWPASVAAHLFERAVTALVCWFLVFFAPLSCTQLESDPFSPPIREPREGTPAGGADVATPRKFTGAKNVNFI